MAKYEDDDIDYIDFEDGLEDIEGYNPFDVLDDDYDPYKEKKRKNTTYDELKKERAKAAKQSSSKNGNSNNKSSKRNSNNSSSKRRKKKNPVILWLQRIGATLLATVVILVVFLYAVMATLVYGPSKTARVQFVLSVQETSAIGFLANLFFTNEEIKQIKDENAIKDTDDITDSNLVVIGDAANDESVPDIEVIDIKGATYKGKLMIVKDPSRLFLGTVPNFFNGTGMVVAEMCEQYNAVAGINGGEFVDGAETYTAMPVGLVMKDGEVINGDANSTYHVTGITYENKLVIGNMNSVKAKELGVRDCVSIANGIGPFLVVNGEAQDVVGIAGGTNPRTAIGQTANGKILLLVIDGRQVNTIGATFSDLQDIMLQYGAVNASTMDGGTSSQMVYNGEVINVPYSPTGPRTCPTAFLIK